VATKELRENVGKLLGTKLDGLVVLGSNGEFPLLSYQEKLQV
jgi:dihydrodipicolinate synthase/N-acetylneuraminate lyase